MVAQWWPNGGLMVAQWWPNGVLDSDSSGLDSSPGRGTALCSSARRFTLIVPLFTEVTCKFTAGVTLRWSSIPSGGSRNTVEPRYFEPSGEAKNSSKYREFEIANSK